MASGDGADKAFIWKINKVEPTTTEAAAVVNNQEMADGEEEKKDSEVAEPVVNNGYSVEKVCELPGHTETVEFIKFDSSGKWLVTGGMNNVLRVWDVNNGFTLKKTLDNIPNEDLNFVEWHANAPVLMTGGKDYMIWIVNAINGKIMANLIGHEEEVLRASFTLDDKGKHIVSSSADMTIRVWSPLQNEGLVTIRSYGKMSSKPFHDSQILCFALHPDMPVVLSGDEDGCVFAS